MLNLKGNPRWGGCRSKQIKQGRCSLWDQLFKEKMLLPVWVPSPNLQGSLICLLLCHPSTKPCKHSVQDVGWLGPLFWEMANLEPHTARVTCTGRRGPTPRMGHGAEAAKRSSLMVPFSRFSSQRIVLCMCSHCLVAPGGLLGDL